MGNVETELICTLADVCSLIGSESTNAYRRRSTVEAEIDVEAEPTEYRLRLEIMDKVN